MSTGYTQFQNEGYPDASQCGPNGIQLDQGHAPPISTTPGVVVVAPQPQTIISTTNTMPNDYFGLALFVTLCCCLPLGIVGLIKANDVRNRFTLGDFAGAELASQDAKRYSYIGLGIGVGTLSVSIVIVIIYVIIVAAAASSATHAYSYDG